MAEQLLDRHGVLTRGAVVAERIPGGFAGVYPVLKAMEDAGRCRRGYFVDGLGGAQFAVPGAVDRLRALTDPPSSPQTQVLAATDPANPYGAALAWPERTAPGSTTERPGHRPGRKAGAVVILVDGDLVLYVERAAGPCSPSPTTPTGWPGRPTPSPWPCGTAPSAGSRSRRPTAAPCSTPRWPGR